MKNLLSFLGFFLWVCITAQTDSISITANIGSDRKNVHISQRIVYHNRTQEAQDSLKLLNWIAAYQNSKTPLAKRKLEDRNSTMHFATADEFGFLKNLKVNVQGKEIGNVETSSENLFLSLRQVLQPEESVELHLEYDLHLPDSKFTGYGNGKESVLLKYFFLVPDHFYPTQSRNYLDIEETVNYHTYWDIKLNVPSLSFVQSNLQETELHHLTGFLNTTPEILIAPKEFPTYEVQVGERMIHVALGYPLDHYSAHRLSITLAQQLSFIQEKWGQLPSKIFISEKFKNKEDFFGNDDIKLWKFRFPLFAPGDNLALDYISILTQKIIDETLISDKEKNHWLGNGLKSYMEQRYLSTYYAQTKLLGSLPDSFNIFGLKPLRWFHASKLNISDRYGLAYQYMVSQNLDQAITTPFSQLSNFNQMVISQFETGSLMNFVADKMKYPNFENFLKSYSIAHKNRWNEKDFLDSLSMATHYSSDFLSPYIQSKQRANFKINHFKRDGSQLLVNVTKQSDLPIPFKMETLAQKSGPTALRQYWFETPSRKSQEVYIVPDSAVSKLTINNHYFFPENNFRDNYLYTKGLFSNYKKLKFKLIKDIPNPEYNEVYLNPKLNFNIYDEVLLGMNFSNASFFAQPFLYSLTPYYSTGTGKVTGSGALSYSFLPANNFFTALTLGISGAYFHYTPALSYQKYSAGASMLFAKNPRSSVARSVFASFNYYQKDLDALMKLNNEYAQYTIWSVGYGFSDRKLIHEKALGFSVQGMEDYQKVTAEAFYRWEYAQNKKISFRLFAGTFLENKTRNNFFDFGISRVSNYSFSYGLFGQGETDGFWSQQFVLADGGFKSFIPNTANQWLTSFNIDAHAWKIFNLYADFGAYKRKGFSTDFIWDSGVKVKIIPDFVEVYFPIQSSLGFEPGFQDYAKRIRFTLTFNLNAIIGSARRGWF